jgi:hypothetical protein
VSGEDDIKWLEKEKRRGGVEKSIKMQGSVREVSVKKIELKCGGSAEGVKGEECNGIEG